MNLLWKIVKGLAIGAVALIMIAIVAAVIATDTDWFRELVRDKANAVLAGTFKGQLAIGSIQGSIWRELTIDDVTLTYNGERIAHIERMRVAYGILSLLHDTIDLTHLDLSGVSLNATQDKNGEWNALEALASAHPEAATQGGGTTSFRVLIHEVSFGRGAIKMTMTHITLGVKLAPRVRDVTLTMA